MASSKLVWDLPLRLFHWLLVIAIAGAWYTVEEGYEELHMKIGYFIIGLLIFRIIWGFVGTTHSRFVNFIPGPSKFVGHMKSLFKSQSEPYVGHNPLGAISALIMIFLVGLQAVTGLFTKGVIWYGPYTSAVSSDIASKLDSIHHVNFNNIMIMAGIHIAAIFFYLFYKKQNLIGPMITGKKPESVVPENTNIANSRLVLAVILALATAGLTYVLLFVVPPPVNYDDYY